VITTPAIAYLTRNDAFDAGIVISASHNPYGDNGVKVFTAGGNKSDEGLESRIEEFVLGDAATPPIGAASSISHPGSGDGGLPDSRLEERYQDFLAGSLGDTKLKPFDIVLDCANGAGFEIGPRVLSRLGVQVHALSTSPDGENINRDCGSTHPEKMAEAVVEQGSELGAALDGDGDRVLLVDSRGNLVNGDAILLLCARRWKKEGRLGGGVVATVMSNMALEVALEKENIPLKRTPVGDKYVAQEMVRQRAAVGGEQSGHIIFSEFANTGDGLLTLLQVLRVLSIEGQSLEELGKLEPYPQVLVNVRVRERPAVEKVPAIADAVRVAEEALAGKGRVLVRYSGTEPLLRIMMEGPVTSEIEGLAGVVERAVIDSIGERP
jgi:phosphoglucosamine mutase